VDVTGFAHGGAAVARVSEEGGRVVFVRHAIPGERVVVEITEGAEGDRFWRGDAVSVVVPSADRVAPPCPVAGPGGCGGCDLQHVALPRQRSLKAEVVAEQLRRLAGLELPVTVEPVPGDEDGLRWRTRVRYARTPDGGHGMRRYRSHDVVPVADCLIARRDAREPRAGDPPVVESVRVGELTARFTVAADGFWQVHPGAPAALVGAVVEALAPRPGERVLDLYAGVGLFARFLGEAVGGAGRVVAVEGDPDAAVHAAANLAGVAASVEVLAGGVLDALEGAPPEPVDLVVLDPPREGARRGVVEQVVARRPRAAAYVACDPAALARDVAIFAERGYALTALRAFDLFPMTHHVECVALLEKGR
jgi:tRNA/tmRNA/rRNA uracil-C5-methylase (TrmA/RlmC/RlmD family)